MTEVIFDEGSGQTSSMATIATNDESGGKQSNGEIEITSKSEEPQPSPIDILRADNDLMYDGRMDKDGNPNTIINSTALQSLKNYHIDHEKYCGWFRGYVRQDWDTISVPDDLSELKADWSELFFDLIYVACIVHISQEASYSVPSETYSSDYTPSPTYYPTSSSRRLMDIYGTDCPYPRRLGASSSSDDSYCYGVDGELDYLLTAFAQFGLMVKAWEGMVYYTSYFVMNQQMDELFRVCYMLCVVCMGIFVHNDPQYNHSFLISYAFLQGANIMRYIKVGMIPRTRKKALYEFVKSSAIILAIIIIGAAYDKDHTCALDYFWIYFSIFIFEELCRFAMLVVFNGPMTLNLPLNVPHFAERNGLFVTLILGEAIIASMLADLEGDNGFSMSETLDFSGQPPDVIVLFLLLAAFLMTYMISRLYYDCQPPEEEIIHGEENHAMRMSVKTALLYVYSHVFLFFGLLGLGCGVKITASNLQSEEKRALDVMLPGYSISVIVIALFMIRWSHPFKSEYTQRIRVIWVIRMIVLLFFLVAPLFHNMVNQGGLVLIYVFGLALLLALDFEGQERVIHRKHEMKMHRRRSLNSNSVTKADRDKIHKKHGAQPDSRNAAHDAARKAMDGMQSQVGAI